MSFPGGSDGKASACNVGDRGSIPGLGRSPGEGNGNPLQYSCLENPMEGGAWWATVHGVAKSRTGLSDFTSQHLIGSASSKVGFSWAQSTSYVFLILWIDSCCFPRVVCLWMYYRIFICLLFCFSSSDHSSVDSSIFKIS